MKPLLKSFYSDLLKVEMFKSSVNTCRKSPKGKFRDVINDFVLNDVELLKTDPEQKSVLHHVLMNAND